MLRFTISTADISEYTRIAKFLKENGLEFSEEELKTPKDNILKMWKVTQGVKKQSEDLVAACIICERKGNFVVSNIAVDRPMRKTGLGKILMKKAEDEIRSLGGQEVWLAAKVPEFYEKLGYGRVDFKDSPEIFSCATCPLNGVDCKPQAMTKKI